MESVDGRTVAQPNATTEFVYVNAVADLLFVDIQLYVFPASRHGERGCPRKHPNGLFCWTVGWWEVFYSMSSWSRV